MAMLPKGLTYCSKVITVGYEVRTGCSGAKGGFELVCDGVEHDECVTPWQRRDVVATSMHGVAIEDRDTSGRAYGNFDASICVKPFKDLITGNTDMLILE